MHKLLSLKEEERRTIDSELTDRGEALRDVDNFTGKRGGLQDTIDRIQRDHSAARVDTLTKQTEDLEEEMHGLEIKLMEMKAQHWGMLNEISQLQNSVDSRLSSYKESLTLLDADVLRYLQSPPVQPLASDDNSAPNFYSLNPKRRTLEMAKEHWAGEQVELTKRQRTVDLEIDALKEGGGVWNQAVTAVAEFEKMLAEEMHQSTASLPSAPAGLRQSSGVNEARADAILDKIDDTTAQLQDLLNSAEQKDWNLLICSIGAELEAFRQAKPILLTIFRPAEDEDEDKERHGDDRYTSDDNDDVPPEFLTRANEQSSLSGLDEKVPNKPSEPGYSGGVRTAPRRPRNSREDEDDEPDPAWLLP